MCQHRRLGYTNEILYIDTVRMNMGESQLGVVSRGMILTSLYSPLESVPANFNGRCASIQYDLRNHYDTKSLPSIVLAYSC